MWDSNGGAYQTVLFHNSISFSRAASAAADISNIIKYTFVLYANDCFIALHNRRENRIVLSHTHRGDEKNKNKTKWEF